MTETRLKILKWSAVVLLILAGFYLAWMIDTYHPYTKTVVLNRQYIGNISNGLTGACTNCLIMEVSDRYGYNETYYFAGENTLRNDMIEGYEIKVIWKYRFLIGEYRINRVYQPTPKGEFRLANHSNPKNYTI